MSAAGRVGASGLGLGREVPIELGVVKLLSERGGNLDIGTAVLPAGLEQLHADIRILGEPSGEHAPRRTAANDHVIRPCHVW